MEINCNLMFPLERMTLVVLAASLWNNASVRNLISKFNFVRDWHELVERWVLIEFKVLEKAKLISLPNGLKSKLLVIIKPIGFEILTWMDFHVRCCGSGFVHPGEFCWSSAGTIDRKATAQMLLQNQTLDVKIRYALACIYCLQDDIPLLWQELDESYRYFATNEKRKSFLVKYWSLQMSRKVISDSSSPHVSFVGDTFRNAFTFGDVFGNKTAIKYILQHFSNEERDGKLTSALEDILLNCSYRSSCFTEMLDSLFFIFTKMKRDQQIDICSKDVHGSLVSSFILEYFLNWPMQQLFILVAQSMKNLLRDTEYLEILSNILHKMKDWEDYNYEELYILFWEQVPSEYRNWLSREILEHYFMVFVLSEPSPLISSDKRLKTIFSPLTVAEKQALILDSHFLLQFFDKLYAYNEQNLIRSFLGETITSLDVLAACRNKLTKTFTREFGRTKHQLLMLLDNWETNISV